MLYIALGFLSVSVVAIILLTLKNIHDFIKSIPDMNSKQDTEHNFHDYYL